MPSICLTCHQTSNVCFSHLIVCCCCLVNFDLTEITKLYESINVELIPLSVPDEETWEIRTSLSYIVVERSSRDSPPVGTDKDTGSIIIANVHNFVLFIYNQNLSNRVIAKLHCHAIFVIHFHYPQPFMKLTLFH